MIKILKENINNELIKKEKSIANELNKLQIIKRRRELDTNEKNILLRLRSDMLKDENFNRNQCGIAILLENTNDFQFYYNKLDADEKSYFDTFPIKTLL